MAKKRKCTKKCLFIFTGIIFLILASLLVVFVLAKQTGGQNQYKTFKSSSVMDFTIEMPKNFNIEEKGGRSTIHTPIGDIWINRSATNFSNLNDYLNYLDQKNYTQINNQESKVINNYSANIREIKINSVETQKYYVFYIEGTVYSIFTQTSVLYPILDQIAQSFRYTPN